MSKEIELSRGTCFQHFWKIDEMKKDYHKLCKKPPLISNELEYSIDLAMQIAEP